VPLVPSAAERDEASACAASSITDAELRGHFAELMARGLTHSRGGAAKRPPRAELALRADVHHERRFAGEGRVTRAALRAARALAARRRVATPTARAGRRGRRPYIARGARRAAERHHRAEPTRWLEHARRLGDEVGEGAVALVAGGVTAGLGGGGPLPLRKYGGLNTTASASGRIKPRRSPGMTSRRDARSLARRSWRRRRRARLQLHRPWRAGLLGGEQEDAQDAAAGAELEHVLGARREAIEQHRVEVEAIAGAALRLPEAQGALPESVALHGSYPNTSAKRAELMTPGRKMTSRSPRAATR